MPADQLINGVWPEGTKLRLKANRDPSDVNGAWHTEGQMYELEVQAEDDITPACLMNIGAPHRA